LGIISPILLGILDASFASEILKLAGIKSDTARGFAIGLSSHGIDTARAFQISEEAGAFAGSAIDLNGVATALLVPVISRLIGL
jgi:putative effector of murein hydrolase